ncbi:MAG: hypothetical protein ACXU82_10335 [Caulobacteraceae bacterium]
MPISIRLLMIFPRDFAFSLKVRVRPRPVARVRADEQDRLRLALSRRLPPHLTRDVLPD